MLIICPECGAQISDRAVACPHCGYSLAEVRQEKKEVENAIAAAQAQAAFDASFRPNELYLASPMPFKALFRAFTTKGRASRAEFWSFFVVYILVDLALIALCNDNKLTGEDPRLWLFCVWLFYGAIALMTAQERRAQDAGVGNCGCLICILGFVCLLIPIVGWLVFVACLCAGTGLFYPSVPASNEFGPPPDFWYHQHDVASDIVQDPQSLTQTAHRMRAGECFNVACPYCGENCEVPNTVIEGQHVICPYCGERFVCRGMG